jgi:hypothetical protein
MVSITILAMTSGLTLEMNVIDPSAVLALMAELWVCHPEPVEGRRTFSMASSVVDLVVYAVAFVETTKPTTCTP